MSGNWVQSANVRELRERLRGWNNHFMALLDTQTNWSRWPLFAAPLSGDWHKGNVALIGDAAHAMLPFSAQGAAMGIEDAYVLARHLAEKRDADMETALGGYVSERKPRVRAAARLARTNRAIYHMGLPLSLARNLVMSAMGGEQLLARQDWLYEWEPAGLGD